MQESKNETKQTENEQTFSEIEISDEEIDMAKNQYWIDYEWQGGNLYSTTFGAGWKLGIKWYREQLKSRKCK